MKQDIEVSADHPSQLSSMNTREQALLATYDFLKHMSTLSVVAMGGMLGLAQGAGTKIDTGVILSVAMMGICGALSLVFMAGAAATQIAQRVHKSSNGFALGMVVVIVGLFGASIGAFTTAFLHGLAH
jgi:hypothetical protein